MLICTLLEEICISTEVKSAFSCALTVLNPREFVLMANELLLMADEFAAMRADKEAIVLVPAVPVTA